jgi:transposase
MARLDLKLLSPLKHRGEASQAHLALLRSREALVSSRTKLVNHVRGAVKSFGGRLPKCSAQSFHKKAATDIPEPLKPALEPLLETIESFTTRIRQFDRQLEALAEELYPETKLLRQVNGVGPLSALAFVLILENPERFETSRMVGAYAGLVPARHQSGESDPQKRISKRGDEMLRHLLVSSSQYILGPFGWGGLGSQTPRSEDSRAWRQESQETSGGSGSSQARGAAASSVAHRRALRPLVQRPSLLRRRGSLGKARRRPRKGGRRYCNG